MPHTLLTDTLGQDVLKEAARLGVSKTLKGKSEDLLKACGTCSTREGILAAARAYGEELYGIRSQLSAGDYYLLGHVSHAVVEKASLSAAATGVQVHLFEDAIKSGVGIGMARTLAEGTLNGVITGEVARIEQALNRSAA